jgi:hypothetical protein
MKDYLCDVAFSPFDEVYKPIIRTAALSLRHCL